MESETKTGNNTDEKSSPAPSPAPVKNNNAKRFQKTGNTVRRLTKLKAIQPEPEKPAVKTDKHEIPKQGKTDKHDIVKPAKTEKHEDKRKSHGKVEGNTRQSIFIPSSTVRPSFAEDKIKSK